MDGIGNPCRKQRTFYSCIWKSSNMLEMGFVLAKMFQMKLCLSLVSWSRDSTAQCLLSCTVSSFQTSMKSIQWLEMQNTVADLLNFHIASMEPTSNFSNVIGSLVICMKQNYTSAASKICTVPKRRFFVSSRGYALDSAPHVPGSVAAIDIFMRNIDCHRAKIEMNQKAH